MAVNTSLSLGRTGKVLGYTGFFIVALVFFLVLTFPDAKLRGFLSTHASNMLGAPVAIEEGGLSGLGSIDLSGIQIRLGPIVEPKLPGAPPEISNKKKRKPKFRIITADRLSADASLTSALFGDAYEASFDGELMGGRIDGGTLSLSKDDGKLSIGITAIQELVFGSEQLFKGWTAGKTFPGVDLRGQLSGDVKITLGRKPTDIRGAVTLNLSAARILKPVLPQGLELTDVDLGTLRLKIVIDEVSNIPILGKRARRSRNRRGKVPQSPEVAKAEPVAIHLAELSNDSDEILLSADPRSVIRVLPGKPWSQAVADLHLAVEILPAFRDKKVADTTTGEQVAKNKTPLSLMKGLAQVRAATLNGVIGIKCTGALKDISCKLARPRRGSIKSSKPKFGRDRKPAKKPPTASSKDKPSRPSSSARSSTRDRPSAKSASDRARERAERRRKSTEKRRAAAEKRRAAMKPRAPISAPRPGAAGRFKRPMTPTIAAPVELSPEPGGSPGADDDDGGEAEGEEDDETDGEGDEADEDGEPEGDDGEGGEDSDDDE